MTDKEKLIQRLENCGVGLFKIIPGDSSFPQLESRIVFYADNSYGGNIGSWSFDHDGKLLPDETYVDYNCTALPFGEYWDNNKLPTVANLKNFFKEFWKDSRNDKTWREMKRG